MARYWMGLLLAAASVCLGDVVEIPTIEVDLVEGKGFNISIPDAGKQMEEFKYFVNINQEFKDSKDVFCKGRVECVSEKSRFRLEIQRVMKEGDKLHFYLLGYWKPNGFQAELVYEVKKNDKGQLEFQPKIERVGLQKEGIWYELDTLPEITSKPDCCITINSSII